MKMGIDFIIEHIHTLFLSFLTGGVSSIDQLEGYNGNIHIEQNYLIFSLPDLFDFCRQFGGEEISYQEFKRQLYQSTLNQDLKAHGAQVVVHYSTGKVETNLYRLERLPAADNTL